MKAQIALLLVFLIFSCKKEVPVEEPIESGFAEFLPFIPGDQKHGTTEGTNLGEEWIGSASSIIWRSDSIRAVVSCNRTSSTISHFTEDFAFTNIPISTGSYFFTENYKTTSRDSVNVSYYFNDWDVLGANYRLKDNPSNEFIITKIDTITKIIEGSFSASFVMISTRFEGTPDSAVFKKMKFSAEIIE